MDELKESGQLELEDGFCIITPRGRQTAETLENDPRIAAMAEYPYDGSIRRIDDILVVKLG